VWGVAESQHHQAPRQVRFGRASASLLPSGLWPGPATFSQLSTSSAKMGVIKVMALTASEAAMRSRTSSLNRSKMSGQLWLYQ
jgi:hypothetical protein